MKRVKKLNFAPAFLSYSSVGGLEELRGPLGDAFDFIDTADKFGQKTWELAEGEMGHCALNIALSKSGLSHKDIGLIIAGDLQNQCVATSLGLSDFGIPYLGVYGACSTCTESLLILSSLMSEGYTDIGCAVTGSHNSAAERQFRTPIEYGGQRSPSAQWTATAAGAFILSLDNELLRARKSSDFTAEISEIMVGRIVDGAIKDASNMGGAMAFAAADSILTYFADTKNDPRDFDYIITGDLGRVGSDILEHILREKLPSAAQRHVDCGLILYDRYSSDVHSGASGCGTSASVLASHFLPLLETGEIKNVLFLSTGALMSPTSVLQGKSISGIAPLIRIEARKVD